MSIHRRRTQYCCLASTLVLLPLLIGPGCGNNNGETIPILQTWTQFQSGFSGEGFIAVDTELAVPPFAKWETPVGETFYGFGSPVISPDGNIYVGTLEGDLVAIDPDGNEVWRTSFAAGSTLLSTPAVADTGEIFVVVTHTSGSDVFSTLNRVSSDGVQVWEVPAIAEGRRTTSSPRVLGNFVFLYVPSQVGVWNFDGDLVDQETANICEPVCGSSSISDFFTSLLTGLGSGLLECTVLLPVDSAQCWDNFKAEFDGSVEGIPPADPTVAIVTAETVVGSEGPMLISLNNVCMTGFRIVNGFDLQSKWVETVYGGDCGDSPVNHGSPAIVGGGMLVKANARGEVTAYDPVTGEEFWEYESDDSFLSTPASFVRPIYVASSQNIHLLSDNGTLISKRPLLGRSQASVALSSSHAYLSTSIGLFTFEADPSTDFTLDSQAAHRTATPAIGDDGTIYALTDEGTLKAYGASSDTVISIAFQTMVITQPEDGASISAGANTTFSATVSSASADDFDGETTFTSDVNGELCTDQGTGTDFSCQAQLTTVGQHLITATSIDASGTVATDSITVQVIDAETPPTVEILSPAGGAIFGASQVISFTGTVTDPNESIANASITWTSDQDGLLGTGETITSTLSEGTHVVTLSATDSTGLQANDSVTVQVNPGEAPTVQINGPADSTTFLLTDQINLLAQATDPQDGTLTGASLVWVSDLDGMLGSGEDLTVLLTQGTHTIVVTATNSLDLSANDSVSAVVILGTGVPVVTISSPSSNTKFGATQTVTLVGSATDPEDSSIPGASFRWISDIDGELGTGATLGTLLSGETDPCDTRTHTITLEVTDSDGNKTTQQIIIRIGTIC
jgi:outer membrane protein assembly factor BamB